MDDGPLGFFPQHTQMTDLPRIRRYLANVHYDNTGCGVLSSGDAKYFYLRVKLFKGFFEILLHGMLASIKQLVLFSQSKCVKT